MVGKNNQHQQQQLYISPQAENLTYMYSLVEKLMSQLKSNKLQKELLIKNIDSISRQALELQLETEAQSQSPNNNRLNEGNDTSNCATKINHNSNSRKIQKIETDTSKDDIALFDMFLSQRIDINDIIGTNKDNTDINDVIYLDKDNVKNEHATKEGVIYSQVDKHALEKLRRQNQLLKEILVQKRATNKETYELLKFHQDSLNKVVSLLRNDVYEYHSKFIQSYKSILNNELYLMENDEFQNYISNINSIQILKSLLKIYKSLFSILTKYSSV
ncbi:hypothetical protein TBLA_0C00510 [Henningerozyma blattae CBS 6284]|uniref:Uncharacterized protein n=1 Tax=Henningerozyma blattae (strain ATCC 34711 / CBS 6284 / DSM 70876 / NBRC 10599 / NRRL Y-10934 / UCD 77-7) TaxID=1071380 RepID=I2H0G5_HENB6|nr:hypothetical protein TBLA_0C00510 [Tetrapisispora blattae CBS 6284]CCH59867.1 hypothetical protein TBLA_0C00510 [Tetrapisispora blattae CBS 6284]